MPSSNSSFVLPPSPTRTSVSTQATQQMLTTTALPNNNVLTHPIQEDKLAAVVAAAEVAASMYDAYQAWALKTYGDSAKTKTVTRKKYNRIMKILRGEESSSVENSKFRFWVKAKGFKIAPDPSSSLHEDILFVPEKKPGATGSSSPVNGKSGGGTTPLLPSAFKRVAVVENFYDIIYNVHVEMDGRSGKHAGQKRTYRAVAEMYAFLPREAVTRFLMSCSDCQKRMHLQYTANGTMTNGGGLSSHFSKGKKSETIRQVLSSTGSIGSSNSQDQDDDPDEDALGILEDDEDEEVDDISSTPVSLNQYFSYTKSPDPSDLLAVFNNGSSSNNNNKKQPKQGKKINRKRKDPPTKGTMGLPAKRGKTHPQLKSLEESSQVNLDPSKQDLTDDVIDEADDLDGNEIVERARRPDDIDDDDDDDGHRSLHIQEDEDEDVEIDVEEEDGDSCPCDLTKESSSLSHPPSSIRRRGGRGGKPSGGGDDEAGDGNDLDVGEGGSNHRTHQQPLDMSTRKKGKGFGGGKKKSNHPTSRSSLQSDASRKLEPSTTSRRVGGPKKDPHHESLPAPTRSDDQENDDECPVSPATKLKNRERLLAALTALNGHRGIIRPAVSSTASPATNSPQQRLSSSDQIKIEVDDDDDDEEEDNDTGKGDSFHDSFDPERLKAFNMFVRLFVDENLDRMIPISRQPKEKIQAIIDSCGRQFPEFSDRARKRIRTYLKSCRRTRRHKSVGAISPASTTTISTTTTAGTGGPSSQDMNNEVSSLSRQVKSKDNEITNRSSSPLITCSQLSSISSSYHLSSPLAEQILATACDNEFQNVKRMKMGLHPIIADSHFSDTDSTDLSYPFSTSGKGRGMTAAALVNGHHNTSSTSPSLHHLVVNGCHLTSTSPASSSCLVSPILSASSSSSAIQALRPSNSAHSSSSSLLAALCQQQQLHIQQNRSSSDEPMFAESSTSDTKHINGNSSSLHKTKLSNGTLNLSDLESPKDPHHQQLLSSSSASPLSSTHSVVMTANSNIISPSSSPSHHHLPFSSSSASSCQRYSLNPSEVASVKQLISGYRESAAFLLRSAEELEQLLLRQT